MIAWELVPLSEGTSYNAYLVQGGEKTALIGSVPPSRAQALMAAGMPVRLFNVVGLDRLAEEIRAANATMPA